MDLPIHWLDSDDLSVLRWNYRTVAIVRKRGPLWDMEIEWQGQTRRGMDPDREEAKARIVRWVEAQNGLPGRARR